MVEDGLADLFGIPGDRLPIRVPGVISAENLVPVAGGIEEIDRLPARNAVPRGPDGLLEYGLSENSWGLRFSTNCSLRYF